MKVTCGLCEKELLQISDSIPREMLRHVMIDGVPYLLCTRCDPRKEEEKFLESPIGSSIREAMFRAQAKDAIMAEPNMPEGIKDALTLLVDPMGWFYEKYVKQQGIVLQKERRPGAMGSGKAPRKARKR